MSEKPSENMSEKPSENMFQEPLGKAWKDDTMKSKDKVVNAGAKSSWEKTNPLILSSAKQNIELLI